MKQNLISLRIIITVQMKSVNSSNQSFISSYRMCEARNEKKIVVNIVLSALNQSINKNLLYINI